MHKQMHRHAARRLYKRDDPLQAVNLEFPDENNTLERRAKAEDVSDDVATVYSVVYVTASASFTGATAGFVTLDPDSTTSAKTTAKAKSSDDDDTTTSATKTKAASTKATTTSASSAKTTSSESATAKSASSSASSLMVATSSSTLATSSIAASSSLASGAAVAKVTSDSSATASSSASAVADSSSGMSGGAKAGVAFGVLIVLGLLVGLAYFVIRKKKAQQKAEQGMEKLEDEKKTMYPSLTSNPVPQPPSVSSNRGQAPPRLSYRPGSQFAANVLGDAEKAAAGASAGAVLGASTTNQTNNPANPFGAHAQTVDASAKEDRPLSPPVELQGSPVPSPTQATFSAKSPKIPSIPSVSAAPKAEFGTAAVVPLAAIAAGSPGAQPNNVHRVQLEFKPSMEDELELKAGQVVRLLHEYDDGWALCIRMDRSQQGVCPRTCLSKLPLKPRPMGPPNNTRPNGPPNGPPGARGPPRGPPRAGPGPNVRPAGPPQAAQPKYNLTEPGPRGSMVPPPLSPIPSSPSERDLSPQKRSRSMSVSTPAPISQIQQQGAGSPTKPTPDAHKRSISMGSVNAQKANNTTVGPSPLGIPTRKPVPGQAL